MTTRLPRPLIVAAAAAAVAVVVLVLTFARPGPRLAAADTSSSADTVTVVGVGRADGAPDTLTVDFTVHVTRPSVQTALDAQALATRKVFAALQRSGVARKHLQTTDLELNRHYDEHGNPVGYDASETVQARVTPLAHAGRTISAGATAAGDNVDVGDMSFDVANDDGLLTSARANAYADAKARAAQYAQLAGRSLGSVQKITEVVDAPDPITYGGSAGMALRSAKDVVAAEPLRAGQQTLTVQVTVSWALN